MDRRTFIVLTLAGCADPQLIPTSVVTTPGPGTPPAPTPVATGPVGASGDPNFDAWMSGFYQRARNAGLSAEVLDRELAGLTPDDRGAASDSRQPEFSKPIGDYVKGVATADRLAQGRRFR